MNEKDLELEDLSLEDILKEFGGAEELRCDGPYSHERTHHLPECVCCRIYFAV